MKDRFLTYKESPDAWQTKIHVLMRMPFPLPWLFIAGILFVPGFAIIFYCNENYESLRNLAINCVLIAAIANSVIYYEKLLDDVADTFPMFLDEPPEKVKQWVVHWYQIIFWSKKNVIMGIVLGLLCLLSTVSSGTSFFHSIAGIMYSYFLSFIVGFLGGSMFWAMLGVAGMTLSLGRDVKIRQSIFHTRTSVLQTASSVLWKVSLTAALVYLFGTSTFFLSFTQFNTRILILPLVFGVFIIFYFILPQVNIHKTLAATKLQKLTTLTEQLDNAFNVAASDPTPENINQLRDLFQIQNIVSRKRSWAFGVGELLVLVGSILLPLLLFMLKYFLRE